MESLLNCKYCGVKPKLSMSKYGSYYKCPKCGRTAQSDAPTIYTPYSIGEGIPMARYRWNEKNKIKKGDSE